MDGGGQRERKSRDKNKGTRRGMVGMGYARIKIEKEKEWNDEYREKWWRGK